MTSSTQSCVRGGTLVSLEDWLPEAAFDRDWGDFAPAIGCNHLICGQCGHSVRWLDGWQVAEGRTLVARDLTGLQAPEASELLVRSSNARLYHCQCSVRQAFSTEVLAPGGEGFDHRPESPWRCAGHPSVALPVEVDGLQLDANTPLSPLVAAALRGRVPVAPPWGQTRPSRVAGYWLIRLYALIEQAQFRYALGFAVAPHLESEEPAAVLAALNFYQHHPLAPGAYQAAAAVARRAAWMQGIQQADGPGLYDVALETLGRLAGFEDADGSPRHAEAVEAARSELLSGRPAGVLLYALRRTDAKWILRKAEAVADAHPDNVGYLAMTLRNLPEDQWFPVLARIGRRSAQMADEIARTLHWRVAATTHEALVQAMKTD